MTVQTISVPIPQPLYHRLERLADLTRRPGESLVAQTLAANVPPLPDSLPEGMRADLLALEKLDDDALWQVAHSTVQPTQQARHSLLLEKNRQDSLTEPERARLMQLRQEVDQLMLRKVYAYVLLKWRGYRLPTLAELEAVESRWYTRRRIDSLRQSHR